jgi:dTDP-4-dehydrorhamnose 3,5-epimerase
MAIEIQKTPLDGLLVVKNKIFRDERGFFVERSNSAQLKQAGIEPNFVQDNHSRSKPNVLRGLHYQLGPNGGQTKFVGVYRGRIWDVAVDLREGSPTYGQNFGIELSDENALHLFIPAGFAHGFCVLGNTEADVVYKVNQPYNPKLEGGFHYLDEKLAIQWPFIGSSPIVSARDLALPNFNFLKI